MPLSSSFRWTFAGLSAFGAATFTYILGSPLQAIWPAALLGGLSVWLLTGEQNIEQAPKVELTDPDDILADIGPIIEQLLNALDDPLMLVERQQVVFANPAALKLLGSHIIGEDVRLAIRHPAAAERLIDRGEVLPDDAGSVQLVGLGDAERRWDFAVHELGGQRRLVRLVDRTSSYAAERMRVDFVANASHELRTPLATLIGFIETLEEGQAAEDVVTRSRFLKIMSGEAKRMQQLVNDLISLSRIEAEKFTLPDNEVALAPLVTEVTAALSAGLDDGESARMNSPTIAADLTVRGDRAQLSQLLHNLIGNALKYGRAGSPVTVDVSYPGDGMIQITVADQGDGISPEHLPRVTERFYRVDPGRSRAMGGTGLGLAIVKHIVERHRGRLDIASTVGEGTTVKVLLPVDPEPLS